MLHRGSDQAQWGDAQAQHVASSSRCGVLQCHNDIEVCNQAHPPPRLWVSSSLRSDPRFERRKEPKFERGSNLEYFVFEVVFCRRQPLVQGGIIFVWSIQRRLNAIGWTMNGRRKVYLYTAVTSVVWTLECTECARNLHEFRIEHIKSSINIILYILSRSKTPAELRIKIQRTIEHWIKNLVFQRRRKAFRRLATCSGDASSTIEL